MITHEPEDVIYRLRRLIGAELRVAMLATVQRVYGDRVDVQPIIQDRIVDEEEEVVWETLPVIQNVPLQWSGGGGASSRFPITPGDTVLLVICDRAIGDWTAIGGTRVQPQSVRLHDPDDAVAIPRIQDLVTLGATVALTDRCRTGYDSGPAAGFEATLAGKVRVGNASQDLLAIVNDLFEALLGNPPQAPITFGLAPLDPAGIATVTALQLRLASIKE